KFPFKVDFKIDDSSRLDIEYPPMDFRISFVPVLKLERCRFYYIHALLLYIQFHQAVITLVLIGNGIELSLMEPEYIPDISQPAVQLPKIRRHHPGLATTTIVMSTDNNMFDL